MTFQRIYTALALTMLLVAWTPIVGASLAHAQRCPAGADAFLNCLPLDHRYGGPGTMPRLKPTADGSQTPSHDCILAWINRNLRDPAVRKMASVTVKGRNPAINAAVTSRTYPAERRRVAVACAR